MEYVEEEIQDLVRRAQEGDQDAVAALFECLSTRIYRYLRLRVSNQEIAEDLTQTVFVEMLQALKRYKRESRTKFSTWLFQIARFRLIDHYRKERPSIPIEDVPERAHPNLTVAPQEIDAGLVDKAIRRLPEKFQTVLHLRFREDLDPSEIATVLGTSTINVRVIQHRALKALRAILERNEP